MREQLKVISGLFFFLYKTPDKIQLQINTSKPHPFKVKKGENVINYENHHFILIISKFTRFLLP